MTSSVKLWAWFKVCYIFFFRVWSEQALFPLPMAVVRGPFLLVLLILVSFSDISLGQYSVRVQNCTSGHTIAVGDYFYSK